MNAIDEININEKDLSQDTFFSKKHIYFTKNFKITVFNNLNLIYFENLKHNIFKIM